MFGRKLEIAKKVTRSPGEGGQKMYYPGLGIGTLFAKLKKWASASLFCYISMQVTLFLRAGDATFGVIS